MPDFATISHPDPDVLRAFLAGRLSAAEAAPVEEHVADCATCHAAMAEVESAAAATPEVSSDDLLDRIRLVQTYTPAAADSVLLGPDTVHGDGAVWRSLS